MHRFRGFPKNVSTVQQSLMNFEAGRKELCSHFWRPNLDLDALFCAVHVRVLSNF